VALSLVNTHWADGIILTGAALRSEFNNIYNNPMSLISPATGDFAMGGNKITGLSLGSLAAASLSATGNAGTGVYFSTAAAVDITTNGVRVATFGTVSGGVNYLTFSPSSTTGNLPITATGSDTNIGLSLITKGNDGELIFARASGSTIDGRFSRGRLFLAHAVQTGTNSGDVSLGNTGALRWLASSGLSSANYGIHGSDADNVELEVPTANDKHNFYWAGSLRGHLESENSGMGIVFNGESSGDHSSPAAGGCVIFTTNTGGGKTQLMVRFPTGAAQQIKVEA
jgi:hypothetical protein